MSIVRESNLRREIGMKLFKNLQAALALSLVASLAPSALADAKSELFTYKADDGKTYYAYSVTPAADVAAERPSDVVILFDTSASQTGAYRETALSALEAALAKLGPEDRVSLVAADLEGRPISDKLLKARSPEVKAAVEKLRGELPLGSTDGGGWGRLNDVLSTLDPDRLGELLNLAPHVRAQLRVSEGVR